MITDSCADVPILSTRGREIYRENITWLRGNMEFISSFEENIVFII